MRVAIGNSWEVALVLPAQRAPKAPLIKLIASAMYCIRSGLGCRADDTSSGAATFSRRNAGLNLKFGNRVRWRVDSNLTKLPFIIVGAIERKIVARRPGSVYH